MSVCCHTQFQFITFSPPSLQRLSTITKPLHLVAAATLLALPTLTIAKPSNTAPKSTDWTPVLKTMQTGCDLPDIDNAPPNVLASVTSLSTATKNAATPDGYKTLILKNASAWGYPIKKIQYGAMGAGFSSATVYFTNSQFMALRSRFYLPTAVGKVKASDKIVVSDANAFAGQVLANGFGYNDGRVGVNFSKKTNSITCSWAHLTS